MGARKKRAGIGLGARAGAEAASVELALERAPRLVRRECEGRTDLVRRVRGPGRDGDDGVDGVDRPREARAARVPGCIGGFRGEAVRPVRQPGEVSWRRAALEASRVELALIGDA